MSERPPPWVPFVLPLAGVALAAAVLAWPAAVWRLTFDDSFYYWELARRLVAGEGTTFDGLHRTNGFHPLWLLVCAPLALVGLDGLWLARAALAGQAVAMGASFEVLRRHFRLPVDVVAVTALGPAVVKTWVNGLESGLVLPLHAALLCWRGSDFGWSVLASLAFLARTDAGFLVLCSGLIDLWKRRPLVAKYLLPGVVIVAFMAGSQWLYGTPVQVSGQLKATGLTPLRLAWTAAVCLVPFVVARPKLPDLPSTRAFLDRTAWYLAFCCVLLGYYTGVQTFPRLWYFAPHAMYGTLLLAHVARDIAALGAKEGREILARSVLLVPLVVGWVPQVRTLLDPTTSSVMEGDAEAGRWIGESLPPDAVVGSWDAGVIGYFAQQPVVNLDGVVNDTAYLRAMRAGRTAELLGDLTHVCNHDDASGEHLAEHARWIVGPRAEGWTLVHRWDYTFSGTTQSGPSEHMSTLCYELPPAP